jgi:multidrug efflux system membrane fusion protein
MKRLVKSSILPLSLLALAAGSTACGVSEAPAAASRAPRAIAVRVAPVRHEKIARPVHATGRVGYSAETRLSFKVGGVVARILVDDGAEVRRGQLLARLDPREIDAQLSSAESARVKAERDLARARVLRREDVVAGEVLENATTAAEVARATADAARFNRRFSEIRAPADGIVLARLVEPGEVVGAGTPVLLVGAADATAREHAGRAARAATDGATDASTAAGAHTPTPGPAARSARTTGRVVRIGVADRDVVRLAVGDPATIRLDALPGHSLEGVVDEIAPAATPRTGSFEVTVRIIGPAADGTAPAAVPALASGIVAEVEVRPRATAPVLTVPLAALVEADGTRGRVFALAADRRHVSPREVEIAFLHGDRVALVSGLDGVDEVVSDGAPYLDERSVVAVKP